MSLSWSFYILFPCILSLFTRKIFYSLWILSFFSSFSATAAVNFIGENELGSGIPVSWFGLMFAFIILYFRRDNVEQCVLNCRSMFLNNLSILIYWFIIFVGLIFLNTSDINAVNLDVSIFKNPGLDATNIVRFVFLTLGLFFVYQFSNKARSKEVIFILNSMIVGVTAACLIGLLGNITGSLVFSDIFNTNIGKFAQGYTAEGKISGPSVEPSILVQTIGISLSIALVKLSTVNYAFTKYYFFLLICILIQFITLIFSGAHTAIPVLVALLIQVLIFSRLKFFKFVMLACIPIVLIPYLTTLEEKFSTFSGLERLNSILYSFDAFLENPIIGYGFAEVTTHDLMINSLVNTGIFASIILFALPISTIFIAYNNRVQLRSVYVFSAPITALLNLYFVMSFSGFSHPFAFLYIFVATGLWVNNRLRFKLKNVPDNKILKFDFNN